MASRLTNHNATANQSTTFVKKNNIKSTIFDIQSNHMQFWKNLKQRDEGKVPNIDRWHNKCIQNWVICLAL